MDRNTDSMSSHEADEKLLEIHFKTQRNSAATVASFSVYMAIPEGPGSCVAIGVDAVDSVFADGDSADPGETILSLAWFESKNSSIFLR